MSDTEYELSQLAREIVCWVEEHKQPSGRVTITRSDLVAIARDTLIRLGYRTCTWEDHN